MWSQKKPPWQIAENNLLNAVGFIVDDVGYSYAIHLLQGLVKRLENEQRHTYSNNLSRDSKRSDGRLHEDENGY